MTFHFKINRYLFLLAVMTATTLFADEKKPISGFPEGVEEIKYTSSGDQSQQPALFWSPKEKGKVPLLVGLHTWSGTYKQTGGETVYAEWCQKLGWAFIHPNFRGANWTPDALGSDLAVADIFGAVEYAKANAAIDETRIYCIGVSGGGHASLLMAGRHPEIWAGVSAWCGISDIAEWHRQCSGSPYKGYAKHIEKALGGPPDEESRLASAKHRSPVTWLSNARDIPLDINHGVHDGRIDKPPLKDGKSGSVPFKQSLHAWNAVVEKGDEFSSAEILGFYDTQKVPSSIAAFDMKEKTDSLFGINQPIMRRAAGNTRVTIFEGGHQIVQTAALNWLAAQQKGKPVNWNPKRTATLKRDAEKTKSGK